mmetsp:Transcript_36691/g.43846  ORF Transcript_36691/g.43846 Transcript_36691/m.43846 type:complete len:653 (+) Transcript_36691:22-1980(+)
MYPWQPQGKKMIAEGSETNVEGSIDPSPSLKRSTLTADTVTSANTETSIVIEDSKMKQIDVVDVEGSDGSSSTPERDTTPPSPDASLSPTSASKATNEDSEATHNDNVESPPAPSTPPPSKNPKATVNEGFVTEKVDYNDIEGGNHHPSSMPVSPTNTARTAATSSGGSIYTNTPQKFRDEIPAKSKSSSRSPGAAALLIGMKKPILCIVVFILLCIGITAFFGWFRVPGLDKEIDRLRVEVKRLDREINRLTSEVERLGDENDRFEILNGDLKENADELEGITRGINGTVVELEDSTSELNVTRLRLESDVNALLEISDGFNISITDLRVGLDELAVINQNLKEDVEYLENLTEEFNQTAIVLVVNVRQLNVTHEELTNQVGGLEEISNSLSETLIESRQANTDLIYLQEQLTDETRSLSSVSNLVSLDIDALLGLEVNLTQNLNELNKTSTALNMDLDRLEGDLANFTAENERLELLNKDLNVIANFSLVLNLSASETLTSFTDFMAGKIEGDRKDLLNEQKMLIAMYQRAFKERRSAWSCVYEVQFGERFTDTPINDTFLDSIIDYIDERLFLPLCLDITNFRDFLDANVATTSRDVNSAVIDYTGFADSHYFPQESEIGVSAEDWINASFSCDKLANNYLWTSNVFAE